MRSVCATVLRRSVFGFLTLAAFTLIQAAELSGKNLYVAGSGRDSNSGAQASPYRTIKKALENAAAGDTIFIRAGTYDQSIRTSDITIPSGTSWNNAVTIRAYPGETVVLRPISSCCAGVVNLDSSNRLVSYLVFQDLIIDSSGQPGAYGVRIANGTHHIRLVDVEVKNATRASGVTTIGGADFNEFINLNVHSNGSRNNLDHGIYIATSGNLIDGGNYHHNHAYGIHLYGPSNVHRNVVRNTRSYNNSKGMIVGSGDDNLAYNNLIYDNPNLGASIGRGITRRTRFYNNTIVGASKTPAVTVLSSASDTDVQNNIFWGNGANAVHNDGLRSRVVRNLAADPLFVNAAARDFRVRAGSPAIDAGANLPQVPVDSNGVPRPRGLRSDVGAHEYGGSAADDAPVRTVADDAPVGSVVDDAPLGTDGSSPLHTGLEVGYGRIRSVDGGTSSGISILSYRHNGVLVSEAAIAAAPRLRRGRILARIQNAVKTGVAISNPDSTAVVLDFYFSDARGATLYSGSTTIPPRGQIVAFLDETPFAPAGGLGVDLGRASTFTFVSASPVAAVALRGFVNERSEFLITPLPVAEINNNANATRIAFPHYADGGGWRTEIVLVNPTDGVLSGTLGFFKKSGAQGEEDRPYTIPPRSAITIETPGTGLTIETGWAQIIPSSAMPRPAGVLIVSFKNAGVTLSQAAVLPAQEASALRLHAVASGSFTTGEPGSIQSGVAIANPSPLEARIDFELLAIDGSSTGRRGWTTVPPYGQAVLLLEQVPGFENLEIPFRGFLRASGPAMAAVGLRSRFNERRDFLMTATPAVPESMLTSSVELLFPYFASGFGYETEFILFNGHGGSAGLIERVSQSGEILPD